MDAPVYFYFQSRILFSFPVINIYIYSPKYLDIFQRRGHAHIFSDKKKPKIHPRTNLLCIIPIPLCNVQFRQCGRGDVFPLSQKQTRCITYRMNESSSKKPKWLYTEPNIIIIIQDYYILMLKLEEGKRNSILTNLLNIVTTSILTIGE